MLLARRLGASPVGQATAGLAALLPIGLPLMSPERTADYQRRLGLDPPLPEIWPEIVRWW